MADKRFAGLNGLSAVFGQIKAAIAEKQDKINGKSLSTNDYDNTEKALNAQNASDIVELNSEVEEVKDRIDGEATTYPYADVITINDAVPANLADCSVKVEPVQDLHGYDKPWVGGAGKNKLPLVLADLKTANATGTWADNVYTINGGTITVNTDDGGNVLSIVANGTFSPSIRFNLSYPLIGGLLNGCHTGGGWSKYVILQDGIGGDEGNGFSGAVNNVIVQIYINSGIQCDNLTFRPMVVDIAETDKSFAPYTNICPISGHDEAVVTRDGKNLLSLSGLASDSSVTVTEVNNPSYSFSGNATNKYMNGGTETQLKPSTNYKMKMDSTGSAIRIREYDSSNNLLATHTTSGTNILRFTSDANYDHCDAYVIIYSLSGSVTIKPILFYDNVEDLTFEPYSGKTYTIQLGDTIYGGTVDFDSGVMTVDRASVDLGTLTYSRVGTDTEGKLRFKADLTNAKPVSDSSKKPNALCSEYDVVTPNDTYACIDGVTIGTTGDFRVYVDAYNNSSASDFKAAMDGVQFVYELATPFTIQLTPQQVQLLQGQNTLYASTGDISVTVNGVAGSIGAVQEQVNELAEDVAEFCIDITDSVTLGTGVTDATVIKMGKIVFILLRATASANDYLITGLPTSKHVAVAIDSRAYIYNLGTILIANKTLENDAVSIWYIKN